jgi:hypothetical protein
MEDVGRQLVYPDYVWRPSLDKIQHSADAITIPKMNPACLEAVKSLVRNANDVWDFESSLISGTVDKLMVPETFLTLEPDSMIM